jgi:hypothetical protein
MNACISLSKNPVFSPTKLLIYLTVYENTRCRLVATSITLSHFPNFTAMKEEMKSSVLCNILYRVSLNRDIFQSIPIFKSRHENCARYKPPFGYGI